MGESFPVEGEEQRRRIGVIGPGGVGGVLAAGLAAAGHEVLLAARPRSVRAVRAEGLRLLAAGREQVHRLAADELLPGPVDLAVCATKAFDAEAALRANAAALRGATVVVVQNGLRGLEAARAALGPDARVLGGLALFAATKLEPGRIELTSPGELVLGSGAGRAGADADRAAGLLGSAVPCRAVANFPGAQWTKLLVNQVNAIPAATGLSVQQTGERAALRRLLALAMRETLLLARAAGVRPEPLGPIGRRGLFLLERGRVHRAELVARELCRSFGPVPNYASTLQSIRRGAPTENGELNGAIVRLGRRLRVPVPVNEVLNELVARAERRGRPDGEAVLLRRTALLRRDEERSGPFRGGAR